MGPRWCVVVVWDTDVKAWGNNLRTCYLNAHFYFTAHRESFELLMMVMMKNVTHYSCVGEGDIEDTTGKKMELSFRLNHNCFLFRTNTKPLLNKIPQLRFTSLRGIAIRNHSRNLFSFSWFTQSLARYKAPGFLHSTGFIEDYYPSRMQCNLKALFSYSPSTSFCTNNGPLCLMGGCLWRLQDECPSWGGMYDCPPNELWGLARKR